MHKQRTAQATLFGALLLAASTLVGAASGVYMEPEQFLAEAFPQQSATANTLWISGPLREQTIAILDHQPASARQRYWQLGSRTVWLMNEVGKELPITAGFVIENNQIVDVRVLTFRESRGWEIRNLSFTEQFSGAQLQQEKLDRDIDGISGATLSVRAMTKMSRLALLYHREVLRKQAASKP